MAFEGDVAETLSDGGAPGEGGDGHGTGGGRRGEGGGTDDTSTAGGGSGDGGGEGGGDGGRRGGGKGGGPLVPGARLGSYRIEAWLGEGGMGVVYRARDEERGDEVALKTLTRVDPGRLLVLKQEFRIDVRHRNLVEMYELSADGETTFFTMELVDGVSFVEAMRATKAMPEIVERLRAALPQLARGVAALHAAGLLHLDLKPANILVERDGGRVVVLDFGLVERLRADGGVLRSAGALRGTPPYMAPEQLVPGEVVGPATDWYAVGLVLFEALTGTLPFAEGEDLRLGMRTRHREPPPPSSLCPDVPEELDALCVALLAGDPARRPPGGEVLRRLGLPLEQRAPSSPSVVGRGAELARLEAAWRGVGRRSALVQVTGASGIGKSALVRRFLEDLRRRDPALLVLAGKCYEWESIPFKGFDAVVDALCAQIRLLDGPARRELLADVPRETFLLFRVLQMFEAGLGDGEGGVAADPAERRRRAFRGVKQILRGLCRHGPGILFIDDLHWGDADGARLLVEILSPPDAPSLLVIACHRGDAAEPGPFVRELRALAASQGDLFDEEEIRLAPLGDEDAAALAAGRLEGEAGAEEVRALVREAAGNPFLLEELARAYRDGQAVAAGEAAGSRPSLEEMIRSRVDRLPRAARTVLETVALAGRLPSQEIALLGVDSREETRAVLAALRAADLVRTDGPRVGDGIEVYHDRIGACVTAAMAAAERRRLHGVLADALEKRDDVEADVVAHHCHGAGDLPRAAHHAERAGDRAYASLAFERAAGAYRNALEWGAGAGEAARRLEERLGRALFAAGRGVAAAPHFLAAAQGVAETTARELKRQAVEARLLGGELEPGMAELKALLASEGLGFPASPTRALLSIVLSLTWLRVRGVALAARPPEAAEAAAFATDLLWSAGKGLTMLQPMVGIDFFLKSLSRALKSGDGRRAGRALALLGAGLVAMGGAQARAGERFLEQAEELALLRDDPYLDGLYHVYRGLAEMCGPGRWTEGIEHAERGIATLRAHCPGVGWECDTGIAIVIKCTEATGELREVGVRAAEWMRQLVERGDLYNQMVATYPVGLCRLASGDLDGARRHARWNMDAWQKGGYTVQQFYGMQLDTLCALYAGDVDGAWRRFGADRAHIDRAHLMRMSLSRIESLCLDALLRLSLAAAKAGDRAAHLRAAAECARRLGQESRVDGRPHAERVRGAHAALSGDEAGARAAFEASVRGYEACGMRLLAWCVRRRLAAMDRDEATVAAADAWMRERGVADPARWASLYVPG